MSAPAEVVPTTEQPPAPQTAPTISPEETVPVAPELTPEWDKSFAEVEAPPAPETAAAPAAGEEITPEMVTERVLGKTVPVSVLTAQRRSYQARIADLEQRLQGQGPATTEPSPPTTPGATAPEARPWEEPPEVSPDTPGTAEIERLVEQRLSPYLKRSDDRIGRLEGLLLQRAQADAERERGALREEAVDSIRGTFERAASELPGLSALPGEIVNPLMWQAFQELVSTAASNGDNPEAVVFQVADSPEVLARLIAYAGKKVTDAFAKLNTRQATKLSEARTTAPITAPGVTAERTPEEPMLHGPGWRDRTTADANRILAELRQTRR